MSHAFFTDGAFRAMKLARSLAVEWSHPNVLPAHLLWALLDEESLARELLEKYEVTQDRLRVAVIWNGEVPEGEKPDEGPHEDGAAVAALTAAVASALEGVGQTPGVNRTAAGGDSDELHRVMQESRMSARVGRSGEVFSSHLLAGLVRVESPVSEFLIDCGLTVDVVEPQIRPGLAEPMPVDFEIDWESQSDGELTNVYRILDASANRAREGLRVVEDFVRFSLDDAHLSELLKTARHQLSAALQLLDEGAMTSARDTRSDVGTKIRTSSEMNRSGALDVVRAGLKRAQEATRTLEEYSKVVWPSDESKEKSVPEQFGQVRYELYTIEKALVAAIESGGRLDGCSVYLLLTVELCNGNWESVLREAISGGVRIVQIREKSMCDRELIAHARRVREITRDAGVLLILNDRPDLTVLCGADGVHVGQEELSIRDARRIVGPERLIGVSTHSIEQARKAILDGASYLGVGPVFPSGTKSFDEFVGLDLVKEVAVEVSLPWFAIGGIDQSSIDSVRDAGAERIAVSGAMCRAQSVQSAAAGLVAKLAGR